tara:strand:+ start:4329 stop:4682 length:354 start_codon:yes stop_codon:yes gene_type:complete
MWTSLWIYLTILFFSGVHVGLFLYLIPEHICKKVDEDGNEDDSNKWMWYTAGGILIFINGIILLLFMKYQTEVVVKKIKDVSSRAVKGAVDSGSNAMSDLKDNINNKLTSKAMNIHD